MYLAVTFVVFLFADVSALKLFRSNATNTTQKQEHGLGETFPGYYAKHTGRGIWKWNNALDAYQRHFADMAGQKLSIAEVGVQSGGSLLMWKTVLGEQIQCHGLDINPACKQFAAPGVDITIGDQADTKMWDAFYAKGIYLDILVDDGGHQPHQCLVTLTSAYQHVHAGGYIAIEDIPHTHLTGFFKPTASFLAGFAVNGMLDSVHLHPYLMIVRKGGFLANSAAASQGVFKFSGSKTEVKDFDSMWKAIGTAPPGSHIVLRNPQWTNLFSADALFNFFSSFNDLHNAVLVDTPSGCAVTTASVCTNAVTPNSYVQSRVQGVHIYKDHAVIEIPAKTPWIAAVRKGTRWIEYA